MRVRNRWVILSFAMVAQIAGVTAVFGVPAVLPQLGEALGTGTAQAGAVAGLPSLGLLLTLLLWGVVIDRAGERATIVLSLLLTAAALAALRAADGLWGVSAVMLAVGAAAGPVNAASGRLVLTWFSAAERGFAMGVRQSALPLGVALAALVLPGAAERWGFAPAMTLPAALALAAVPLVLLTAAPPSPARPGAGGSPGGAAANPYRGPALWRVHGVSMLLGVPQVTLMVYALVYLVQEQGWEAPAAGAAVAAAQLPGAAGRLLLGVWSDRTGDRMRPVRWLAAATAPALLLLTLLPPLWNGAAVPLLLVCLVSTMWHNGLTFTAVAELAGTAWAGRALAAQNWLQAVSTTLTPLLMAAVITLWGLPAVFAVAALFAAAAVAAVPALRGARAGAHR
ncbi:MFS transporter [Nocardiopsis flavescens]|uniref:MFS transporter n=1 Tax=Nocardiopsis flavescens TaxID=758803 RepID=UPI00364EA40A